VEELKCQTANVCPNGEVADECTFNRGLCISCRADDEEIVYIRVQTNGMPNHCYALNEDDVAPLYMEIDFEVVWNWYPEETQYTFAKTQIDYDVILCDEDTSQDYNIPDVADFSTIGYTALKYFSGIATSGAVLNNGLSELGADPFYPDYYNLVTDIDDATGSCDECVIH
jgi:hypothetical protein